MVSLGLKVRAPLRLVTNISIPDTPILILERQHKTAQRSESTRLRLCLCERKWSTYSHYEQHLVGGTPQAAASCTPVNATCREGAWHPPRSKLATSAKDGSYEVGRGHLRAGQAESLYAHSSRPYHHLH